VSNASALDPLLPALRDLETCLRSRKIPHLTIGAVAVCVVARERYTNDLDTLIWVDSGELQSLLAALTIHGFESRISDPIPFAQRTRVLLLRHVKTGIHVDLSCGALPFEEEAIQRGQSVLVGGLTLRVATPEDLIVMKAVANRARDIADIESIVDVCESLDVGRIRRWVQDFAELLEMPEILQKLESILRTKGL
jgi:hypothetical protein